MNRSQTQLQRFQIHGEEGFGYCNSEYVFIPDQPVPFDTSDLDEDNPLPVGHLAHVRDGHSVWGMQVYRRDTQEPVAAAFIETDGERIEGLHQLRTYINSPEHEKALSLAILASRPEPVRIIKGAGLPHSFWEELGAAPLDPYSNTTISWSDYENQQRYQAADQGSRPSSVGSPDRGSSQADGGQPEPGSSVSQRRPRQPLALEDAKWLNNFVGTPPARYYQFAGARSATANRIALQAAKQFHQEGRDPDQVFQKTHWFMGEDGRWRYEINDEQALFEADQFNPIGAGDQAFVGPLGEAFDHPSLFAAYPFLKNLDVSLTVAQDVDTASQYTEAEITDLRIIPPAIEARGESFSALKQALTHALQNAIQEAEGFARGGQKERLKHQFMEALGERLDTLQQRYDELTGLPQEAFQLGQLQELDALDEEIDRLCDARYAAEAGHWDSAFYDRYLRLAGEKEAKTVAQSSLRNERFSRPGAASVPIDHSTAPIIQYRNTPVADLAADLAIKPAGSIDLLPRRSIITLTHSANKSVIFHEAGHLFLDTEAKTANPDALTPLQSNILDYLGADSFDNLTRPQHEKFAKGLERYLQEGHESASEKTQGFFATVSQWLRNTYDKIAHLGTPLTDQAREIYSQLLEVTKKPREENVYQAEIQQAQLADELVRTQLYDAQEAEVAASVFGAYALAKAERDPATPTVDRVFDKMNLSVEVQESVTPETHHRFDFDTFNIEALSHAPCFDHLAAQGDLANYELDALDDIRHSTHSHTEGLSPEM